MAEKMLQMQVQMRQNQREITDFLSDLDSWSSDIKKQDDSLKKMKPREQAISAHPPVRSATVVEKVKKKRQENDVKKPERIKSSDYRKWEKLDVDKMLQEVDDEEKELEEEVQLEVDKLDEERRAKVATEMKEKGNEHFKNCGYQAAIECYTTGMQADPSSPIFPANRAMAYLKLNRYAETEADCTLALSLDPTYTKAYLRRGTARAALGKASSARKDFMDALRLEPGNPQAQVEIKKLDKMEKIEKEPKKPDIQQKGTPSRIKNTKYVEPIYIPSKMRSKKPLMRIEVQEVGLETEKKEEQSSINLDEILGRKNMSQPKQHEVPKKPKISVLSESSVPAMEDDTSEARCRDSKDETANTEKKIERLTNGGVPNNSMVKVTKEHHTKVQHVDSSKNDEIPPAPATSFQFQSDVKLLHNSLEKLYRYLKQITPSHIPSLLKQQLETETLIPILRCLHADQCRESIVFDYLYQFAKVRRFEMAVMFISDKEKIDVSKLFALLGKTYPERTDEITFLQTKYGL